MIAKHDRSHRDGILLHAVMACPLCGEEARAFRLRKVVSLRFVEAEFYHGGAACAVSMAPSMPTAMDLLRLLLEGDATPPQHGAEADKSASCTITVDALPDTVTDTLIPPYRAFSYERLPLLRIPTRENSMSLADYFHYDFSKGLSLVLADDREES